MVFLIPVLSADRRDDADESVAPVRIGTHTGVIPREMVQTFADAEAALAAARDEAARLARAGQVAYEAERRRGYDDGLALAREEQAERMIEVVGRTVDYFENVEQRVVALVTDAVRRITLDAPDEARILAVTRSVLSVVRNQKQMTLRLNPSQIDAVQAHLNDLLIAYPGTGYIDLVADSRVAPDACMLESEMGFVEASLEGQLNAMKKVFERVLGNDREPDVERVTS